MKKDVAIFLFDKTGIMAKPWLDAGYICYIVDKQHPVSDKTSGITQDDNLFKVYADLTLPWKCPVSKDRIAFVFCFPPCTHLAVSGARWLKGKGLRLLEQSIAMFATAVEFCEWSEAPYGIENPVSTISTYWRSPDYTFHPHDYTGFCKNDNYTKKTCVWAGNGFRMPRPNRMGGLGIPDDRIHKCGPSEERSNIRSATPLGFSLAVFERNKIKDRRKE